jgi:hypothetical protein
MPSKAKKLSRDVAKLPSIPKELVNLFLTGPMTGEAINEAGAAFKKALVEASLGCGAEPPSGLRTGRGQTGRINQPTQRRHGQNRADRRRQGADRLSRGADQS